MNIYKCIQFVYMSKTISARIDDSLHAKLLERCNIDGLTVSDELNQILNGSLTCSKSIEQAERPKVKDNIDRSNLEQWNKDLEKNKNLEEWLKKLGAENLKA